MEPVCFSAEDVPRYFLSNVVIPKRIVDLPAKNKRHAIYFPSCADAENANLLDKLDEMTCSRSRTSSTWQFKIPEFLDLKRLPTPPKAMADVNGKSAAQDCADRYRAGLPVDVDDCMWGSSGTLSPELPASPTRSGFQEISNFIDLDGPKIRRTRSRMNALSSLRKEALAVMVNQKVTQNQLLVCERPGCRDTVKNVRDLIRHLHIHDIAAINSPVKKIFDRFTCQRCFGRYETKAELSLHICPSSRSPGFEMTTFPRRPSNGSPVKESFCRTLKISGLRGKPY